jgi:(S)-2-hydroxyglutarate dehydrogenase
MQQAAPLHRFESSSRSSTYQAAWPRRVDVVIVGGGIVGASTAYQLLLANPRLRIALLEKEGHVGAHQTGRNSGVIHSGLYYKPGSLKARFALAGRDSMVAFCREYGIAHDVCGKLVVATEPGELPELEKLFARGLEHGIPVRKLAPEEAAEIEPNVRCIQAIRVPTTGICDYKAVLRTYLELFQSRGGLLFTGTQVARVEERPHEADGYAMVVECSRGVLRARMVVNCAGLYSDRLAHEHLGKGEDAAQIVPFRGEYYELVADRRHLVKHLIYPVPNPDFPFLGVHFTRMIDGTVHAGPNAVLAFAREGYHRTDIDVRELLETLGYVGFRKLAAKYWRDGWMEMWRSFSKDAFVATLQRLIPDVRAQDVVPVHAGIRAQALRPDGSMVDDFLIREHPRAVHVCNAPSPAATASLEIGKHIAALVRKREGDLLPSA